MTRGVSLVGYEFDKLWSPPSDREPKPVAAQEARYLPTYLRKDRVGKGHTAQPFFFFFFFTWRDSAKKRNKNLKVQEK